MKIDARTLKPEAQAILRKQVVTLIRAKKLKQTEAGRIFNISRQAIRNWLDAYEKGGLKFLESKNRGRPKTGGRLKGWQAGLICNLIRDRHPEQLKLPFFLWTAEAVMKLIQKKFKITCSVRTVQRYLKSWGFTPQKPKRRAYERNESAVKRWLKKEYPAIRAQAHQEKARIYWGDEMGARSDHQAGRSYSPSGITPTIPGTGKRFRANMISAITNRGDLVFMVYKKGFSSRIFLRFIKRLTKHSRKKVFLIIDSHPAHRSRLVQEWLSKNSKKIRIFFLPAYSPDLNPDEMLNQDVKANAVGKKRPSNQKELMNNIRSYLNQRRSNREIVKRYFNEKSVRYAA